MVARAMRISSWASLIPIQFRGPIPKGRKAKGCRAALASGVCLEREKVFRMMLLSPRLINVTISNSSVRFKTIPARAFLGRRFRGHSRTELSGSRKFETKMTASVLKQDRNTHAIFSDKKQHENLRGNPLYQAQYKTTLKQQINGEKRWKTRWRAN